MFIKCRHDKITSQQLSECNVEFLTTSIKYRFCVNMLYEPRDKNKKIMKKNSVSIRKINVHSIVCILFN